MAQYIKQANIFGRVGSGIGKGLAEQIPKEIERGRLQSGLKELGEAKNLSPFQQFSQLSAIPGVTPQMIQSGTELLRQQARAQALSNQGQPQQEKPMKFPKLSVNVLGGEPGKTPSITKESHLEQAQEGYIPPTIEERDSIAADAFNSNPGFFGNDPQKALDWADSKIAQEEKINLAHRAQHQNLSAIQDNVVNRLKSQSERLNTQVPADLYSSIEDEAIQATKPKKDGGKGLTEQQAMREYGKKLDDASRLFSKIDEIGNWGTTLRPASQTLRSLNDLQNSMEKLGQTDNFAKKLISEVKLSPMMAYGVAQKVSRVPKLNEIIKSIPKLETTETIAETARDPMSIQKTMEIAPRLAKIVKENEKASPLAIAYELEKKGYDASTWLQYVTDNSDTLNLRQRQAEQSATPINTVTPWNDWWLKAFSGIE